MLARTDNQLSSMRKMQQDITYTDSRGGLLESLYNTTTIFCITVSTVKTTNIFKITQAFFAIRPDLKIFIFQYGHLKRDPRDRRDNLLRTSSIRRPLRLRQTWFQS